MMACSVTIANKVIDVDVSSRTPAATVPKLVTEALWKNWTWPHDLTLTNQLRLVRASSYYTDPKAAETNELL